MKITPQALQDFTFLTATPLQWLGDEISGENAAPNPDGLSALECWFAFDTHGKKLPCREPALLQRARRAKASWNAQIKEWSLDVGWLLGQKELINYCHGKPKWVLRATMRQAARRLEQEQGFVPRFARLETFHDQWWPPELDWFDPII